MAGKAKIEDEITFFMEDMMPRSNPQKEYANPIHEYRIAAGITYRELAAEIDIPFETLCALASETLSPVKKNGRLIKAAERLCEFFEVGPQELFPRHVCSLKRPYTFEIQPYETWSDRAADNCGEQFEIRDLARFIIKTGMAGATPRERRIFLGVLYHNETFTAIARKEGVTPPSIAVFFSKSFRRILNAARKAGLPVIQNTCGLTAKQRLG